VIVLILPGTAGARGDRRRAVFAAFALTMSLLVPAYGQDVDTLFPDPQGRKQILRGAIFDGIQHQISILPLPSGGAFSYEYDPQLGTWTRATPSLGSVFADRAETLGSRRFSLAASYGYYSFDKVDGIGLGTGEITTVLQGRGRDPDIGLNQLRFREDVDAHVVTLGALYGVTSRLDVGVTIPFIRVGLTERVHRTTRTDCNEQTGVCQPPITFNDDNRGVSTESTGLGDIVLRGKYRFADFPDVWSGGLRVAAILDVRLPTGDDGDRTTFVASKTSLVGGRRDFDQSFFAVGDLPIGTGIVRVKPQVVASGLWGDLAPRLAVGFELGTKTGITNDFVYSAGFDYTLLSKLTLAVDVLGRYAFDEERPRITRSGVGGTADASTVSLAVGVKVVPVSRLVLFGAILLPLTDTGLTDNVAPTIGAEWTF
jgi:hypothetical protein